MSKETGIILLGILVAILPWLGFPESWRMFFFLIIGITLIVMGLMMRPRGFGLGSRSGGRTFVESDISIVIEEKGNNPTDTV